MNANVVIPNILIKFAGEKFDSVVYIYIFLTLICTNFTYTNFLDINEFHFVTRVVPDY